MDEEVRDALARLERVRQAAIAVLEAAEELEKAVREAPAVGLPRPEPERRLD